MTGTMMTGVGGASMTGTTVVGSDLNKGLVIDWPFEALQLPRSIACVNHHNLVTEIADTRRSGTRGQPLLFSISDWMARVDVEHIWDSNFCEATGGP